MSNDIKAILLALLVFIGIICVGLCLVWLDKSVEKEANAWCIEKGYDYALGTGSHINIHSYCVKYENDTKYTKEFYADVKDKKRIFYFIQND